MGWGARIRYRGWGGSSETDSRPDPLCPLLQQSLRSGWVLGLRCVCWGEGAPSVAKRELRDRAVGCVNRRDGPEGDAWILVLSSAGGTGSPRHFRFSAKTGPYLSRSPLPLLLPQCFSLLGESGREGG
jgi:hypothetical protein